MVHPSFEFVGLRALGLASLLLVFGCKQSDKDAKNGAEASDTFSYCGDYEGPEPGSILEAGTRKDECELGSIGFQDLNAVISEKIGNGCKWRVVMAKSEDVLDEGSCTTAIANEATGGLQLMLGMQEGNPAIAPSRHFDFSVTAQAFERDDAGMIVKVDDPTLWCDVKDGFELTPSSSSVKLARPMQMSVNYARRVEAEPGQASSGVQGVLTSFFCAGQLASDAAGSPLKDVEVNVTSVERRCWLTNSYTYHVTGSAKVPCTGTIDGDFGTDVEARIEIEF